MPLNLVAPALQTASKLSRRFDERTDRFSHSQLVIGTAVVIIMAPKFWRLSQRLFHSAGEVYEDAKERGLGTALKQAAVDTAYDVAMALPIPSLHRLVEEEVDKNKAKLFRDERDKLVKYEEALPVKLHHRLPDTPVEPEHFAALTAELWKEFKNKRTSGTLYANWPKADMHRMAQLYQAFSFANPLHTSAWRLPQVMHNKVMRMGAELLHDENAYGVMTPGGTLSLLEACKTYVRYARKKLGIDKPRIVLPKTAHIAFETANELLHATLEYIDIDPESKQVKLGEFENAARKKDTILLIGSAPNYPYGIFDNIPALAEIAQKHGKFLHVDACLGGFISAFAEEAGFDDLPNWDFKLPAVTSISMDHHKYGWAPKGASGIWFRRHCPAANYLSHAYFDWEGGLYIKPTILGSRGAADIATAYYAMCRLSRERYTHQSKYVITLTRLLATNCEVLDDRIRVSGKPRSCVVAFENAHLPQDHSIFIVAEVMNKRGWELNWLKHGFHICITSQHINDATFLEKFKVDLKAAINHAAAHPEQKPKGAPGAYGKLNTGLVPRRVLDEIGGAYEKVINTDSSVAIDWLKPEESKVGNPPSHQPRAR